MAYRFKLSESFEHGVRRIGVQQIDRAIADLTALDDPAAAVHGSRKALKRLRALLRLARPGLEKDVYTHENRAFRDIARLLAGSRDRHVIQQTLATMAALADGKAKLALSKMHDQIAVLNGGDTAVVDHASIRKAVAALRKARKRFEELPVESKGFTVAFHGLKRSYGQAVDTLEDAIESGDTDDIHEWRKRVQHHWRHMMLLAEAWPEEFAERIDVARALANALGEDHDVALVVHAVGPQGPLKPTAAERREILAFAKTRQDELRREALKAGQAMFAETPRAFRARAEDYWHEARGRAAKARDKVKPAA